MSCPPFLRPLVTFALSLGVSWHCHASELVKIEGLRLVPLPIAENWIDSQLEFVETNGVSMARADDLAFFLENSLRDRGFKSATVDWSLTGSGENQSILLTVDEGKTLFVTSIRSEGNTAIESEAIEELLLAATRKRLALKPNDAVPYVANDVKKGKDQVLELYRAIGFSQASAQISNAFSEGGATITLSVEEGLRHVISSVKLPDPPEVSMQKSFAKLASDTAGKQLTPNSLGSLKTRIRELVVEAGYYHAGIELLQMDGQLAGEVVEVELVALIDWGEIVTIDEVSVRGNEKVSGRFFEKHFDTAAGRTYSPGTTNADVEELLKTGAFESVRTRVTSKPDGTTALEVDVEEAQNLSLGVYGGFATYEGPLAGFEFKNLNLFGSLKQINSRIEFSRRGAQGEIEYIDPWFLWTEYELRGGLFAGNRSEEGYERFTTGGRYSFSRKLGARERNRLAIFGEAAYTNVHEADIAERFLGDQEYFAHMVGVSLAVDHRDKAVDTRKGWMADGSIGVATSALASEAEYFKAAAGFAWYQPVLGDQKFRMRARAGIIKPIGDQSSLPIDLRYFNGGKNSVRSFEERKLGLIDSSSGYPVGGEFFTVFSAEYDFPIKPIEGLSLVPFFDAGNLLSDADDASFDDMRYAVGLGVHYLTPIGPLRVEYGVNPDPRVGEADGTFHIGFGSGF